MNRVTKGLFSLNILTLHAFLSQGLKAAEKLNADSYFQWAVKYSTPQLRKVALGELVDLDTPVEIVRASASAGTVRTDEMVALSYIARKLDPKNVLEIGTCDGATTRNIALNAARATIWTMDLPLLDASTLLPSSDRHLILARNVGKAFAGTPESRRIKQLLGDSANFRFAELNVLFDLVFIDGSHTYDYVKNDTEKIMPVLAPGGVVIWHDCCRMGRNYGVYEYLVREWKDAAVIIEGTSLAYFKKGI